MAGKGYSGMQGESGKAPEDVGSDSGPYAHSCRRTTPGPMTPNIQGVNSNGMGPERGASVKAPRNENRGSGGGDY